MKKIIIVLLIILILCCISKYNLKKYNFEKYEDYDPDKELPYDLKQYQHSKKNIKIFNDNYNSAWLNPQVGYNNPNISDVAIDELTHGMGDFEQEKSIYTPYVNYDLMNNIINDYNINYTLGYNEFDKIIRDKNRFPNNLSSVSKEIIKKLNSKTWINRYDYNPNKDLIFDYIESDINDLNIINKTFIKQFNKMFKNFYKKHNKLYFFKYEPFHIYKYRINKYYKEIINEEKTLNGKEINVFEINIVLLRNHSTHAIHLYLTSFYDKNRTWTNNLNEESNIFNKNLTLIGEDSLDKILISKGNDNNNEFNLIDSIGNDGFLTNIDKVFKKRNEEVKKNIDLKSQFNCFDITNSEKIIKANDKFTCENEFDWYGRPKDIGVWDRPCKNDKECIYYQGNHNYKNNYGKCLSNGKCEMPLNIKGIGYHYQSKDTKPFCYNCKSLNNRSNNEKEDNNKNEWYPVTKLGECCEEQDKNSNKYNKKYDFLNGPDYAFHNDIEDRINAYNSKLYKNGKKYIKYDLPNILGGFSDEYTTYLK
tara:strand:+ start:392 stop:1993 length:1602 start_codon:yes stop_codon:yes gene_type:complete